MRGTERGNATDMLFGGEGGICSLFQGHSPGGATVCVMLFGGVLGIMRVRFGDEVFMGVGLGEGKQHFSACVFNTVCT